MTDGRLAVTRDDGRLIASSVEVARSIPHRMRGLLGCDLLAADGGLWIEPAPSVHTCFMHFPIDVVFLDRGGRVLKVTPSLPPWRLAVARGARVALELPAGAAARLGIEPGQHLALEPSTEMSR